MGERLTVQKPVQELTAEAFEPFGTVINSPRNDSSIVPGFTPMLGVFDLGGSLECEVSRCVITASNVIKAMERHFRTQEAFVATEGEFVLAITESRNPQAEPQPRAGDVALFLMRQGQSVVMKRNVWHATAGCTETATIFLFFVKHAYPDDWEMQPFVGGEIIQWA